MGNPNGFRTVLLLVPPMFMLLPISILTFVLERISNTLLLAQTYRNWRSGGQEITFYGPSSSSSTDPSDYEYTNIVIRINYAPTFAIIGVVVAAYIVSVVGICGVWELRRREGTQAHQRKWSWTTLLTNFAVTTASIAVLVYASVLQGNEDNWQGYEDVARSNQRFTRETWVCQIDKFYPKQNWAGAACGLSKATRFLLIPLTISSALVCLATWILVNDRGGVKWLMGGKGRYGAFPDVIEMKPQYMPVYPQQYLVQYQPSQQSRPHQYLPQSPSQPDRAPAQTPGQTQQTPSIQKDAVLNEQAVYR